MSIKLITDDKGTIVYRKDKVSKAGNPYTTYSTKVSSKKDDGSWISKFYNLKFRKGVDVGNKAKIVIKDSFATLDEYNGNVTDTFMVMDFTVLDNGEGTGIPNNLQDFMQIDDADLEEMPFK